MATITATGAAESSSGVQIRKRPGGPFRWIRSHIIQFLGACALIYMFIPVAIVVIFSFNQPGLDGAVYQMLPAYSDLVLGRGVGSVREDGCRA